MTAPAPKVSTLRKMSFEAFLAAAIEAGSEVRLVPRRCPRTRSIVFYAHPASVDGITIDCIATGNVVSPIEGSAA
jgi:hypothetical protein